MSGTDDRTLQAFVDESQSDRVKDPHCYVLAAGIAEPAVVNEVRAAMEALRLPGQLKVHWRDESAPRRRRVVRARKVVTSQLRIEHAAGPKDPLLWVADAVCGAVTHDRTGEAEYLRMIAEKVSVISIAAD